jgi:hypothetical protein
MVAHLLCGNPGDGVVEHLDVACHPVAILLEARRRNNAVVGDGGSRIGELEQDAYFDKAKEKQ